MTARLLRIEILLQCLLEGGFRIQAAGSWAIPVRRDTLKLFQSLLRSSNRLPRVKFCLVRSGTKEEQRKANGSIPRSRRSSDDNILENFDICLPSTIKNSTSSRRSRVERRRQLRSARSLLMVPPEYGQRLPMNIKTAGQASLRPWQSIDMPAGKPDGPTEIPIPSAFVSAR